ncbi:hypothetical protein ACHAWF_002763 [Thalassiosira exigua]
MDPGPPDTLLHVPPSRASPVYQIVHESGCTLPGDRFPDVNFAPKIRYPVLFVHGRKDSIVIVTFPHLEHMLETIREDFRTKPAFVFVMGHNNVQTSMQPLFIDRLRRYLDQHMVPGVDWEGRFSAEDEDESVCKEGSRYYLFV